MRSGRWKVTGVRCRSGVAEGKGGKWNGTSIYPGFVYERCPETLRGGPRGVVDCERESRADRKRGEQGGGQKAVNPGKRPVVGLAFVFLKGAGFKLYRCPGIQERDLPRWGYTRERGLSAPSSREKSVIRWRRTEAMVRTGKRGRRRRCCRRILNFGTASSTPTLRPPRVSDIPLKII